jgi:2-dehydropantoate 2-reductase
VLREDEAWRDRLRSAVDEACSVARAEGVALDPAGQWAIIESLPADLIPSAARDAAAGGPTELDAISGSVVRAGRRAGVPTRQLEQLLDEAQARAPA